MGVLLISTNVCFATGGPKDYTCTIVEIKSEHGNKLYSESNPICVYRSDPTFFYSVKCDPAYELKKNCEALQMLKNGKAMPVANTRSAEPAKRICRSMGGVVEDIKFGFDGKTYETDRCLFTKEAASISMNFLRRYDGKKFQLYPKSNSVPPTSHSGT